MQKQLSYYECLKNKKSIKNNMIFVLDNLSFQENIGSAFRLADCFNIDEIIIISKTINFKKIEKTARGCNKFIKYTLVETPQEALNIIKEYNYTPFNVEITSQSVPLREIDFTKHKGVALIVGNEQMGVSEEFLNKVENSIHIEMYGNNSSINVATSLAIVAYHVSESKNY